MRNDAFLFIGGPIDGQYMAVYQAGPTVSVAIPPAPLTAAELTRSEARAINLQTAEYYRETLRSEEGLKLTVYILRGMTTTEAFSLLIAGYRPHIKNAI